jgi:hypothetical protein
MKQRTETIIINATKEAAQAISSEISIQPGSQSRVTERNNLDGDAAAWIVIATLAGQALPHVLDFIKNSVTAKQIKKIKIGDWEVENPTPEMIERFMARTQSRSEAE